MSEMTDTGGNPLTYTYFTLPESTDGPVFVVRSPGGPGVFLKADADPSLRVVGRRSGTSNAFVDLATSPLELAWADPADVDVKARANAVTGLVQAAVSVRSTKNP
jgi:hypothetical protein